MRTILASLLALMALAVTASAAPDARYEDDLRAELAAQSAAALDVWAEANRAREQGAHEKAIELYGRVAALAPAFSHATRRQCGELLGLGRVEDAVAWCREALAIADLAENKAALALALIELPPGSEGYGRRIAEATGLARTAAKAAPDDAFTHMVLCQVAVAGDNLPALETCVGRLKVLDPDGVGTNVFETILALALDEPGRARAALERARRAGLDAATYEGLDREVSRRTPWTTKAAGVLGVLGASWGGTVLALVLLGLLMSTATLRAAARAPRSGASAARRGGAEALLRRGYAVVLWLCCAFYYVSIPLLIALVVLVGGAMIYAFFALGHIPVKLVLVIAVLVAVTVWSILRSLFVRAREEDPGVRVQPGAHPRLQAVLGEVAGRIGTAPVSTVFLTPGTDMAVMERGGLLKQLRGRAERCLIIGAGLLDGMTLRQLKAILGHEYGHFQNKDTAGGGFALAVRRSLVTLTVRLAQGGVAAWYNPAWLFVRGFHRVFLLISQGASRLQEVMADRWAAAAYGSRAFVEGLSHVIRRSIAFDAHADTTLREVVDGQRVLANLYSYQPDKPVPPEELERQTAEVMERKPSAYDSHPAPAQRIAWVTALAAQGGSPAGDDDAPAWSLFEDREALERQMTDEVRQAVYANHGVDIPARAERLDGR